MRVSHHVKRSVCLLLSLLLLAQGMTLGAAAVGTDSVPAGTSVLEPAAYPDSEVLVLYEDGRTEVVVYEDAASLEEGLPQLARQEGVALVQPNYTYTSTALSTTDPLLAEQWALYNDGSFQLEEQENPYPVFNDPFALPSAPWQWIAPWWMQSDASAGSTGTVQAAAGVDIGAEDAWALYDGGSRDVVVALVGGALITETVFAWPGLGQLVVQSIGSHDMSVVQACVVVIALVTMVANLLADLVYCLIDPRIRY